MDGSADAPIAAVADAGDGNDINWKNSSMGAEITKLAERREAMRKERSKLMKELKNKRKRLGRLKRKASQLSDKDLFDIVKSRHLDIAIAEGERNDASQADNVAADPAAPSTD